MRFLLYIAFITIASTASGQEINTEQEITLPDYLLSPSELDGLEIDNDVTTQIPLESFENELEMLLQDEKETLELYKFTAHIFVLNKNTNEVTNYSLQSGDVILHKSLAIETLNCLHNYNSLPKNDYVFLNVIDQNSQTNIYHGWMSRRLPGVKPFNHPTYVIRATGCKVNKELLVEEQLETLELEQILEEQPTIMNDVSPSLTMDAPLNKPRIELPDNIILLPDFETPLEMIQQ